MSYTVFPRFKNTVPHSVFSRAILCAMLEVLREVLVQRGGPPARIAQALRQAVGAVWASQFALIAVVGVAAALMVRPRGLDTVWTWAFMGVGAVMFAIMAAFTSNEIVKLPKLETGIRAAILLGGVAALPAVLAAVLLVLDGLGAGAVLLGLTSLAALFLSFGQVTQYAYLIAAQKREPLEPAFQGWAAPDAGPVGWRFEDVHQNKASKNRD